VKSPTPKILLIDIENTPLLGHAWVVHEAEIFKVERHSYILSYSYQWYPSKKIETVTLRDFPGYNPKKHNDKKLCESLWKLLNEAEIVVGQNSDAFDLKKINTRLLFHGMDVLPPRKTVDTLKINRHVFAHPSNKLDDVCRYHGIGRKLPHSGKDLWFGCMEGNDKDWDLMARYNAHDIYLTRALYDLIRPWAHNHPNININTRNEGACPKCGSHALEQRGFSYTRTHEAPRLRCKLCGAWSLGKKEVLAKKIHIV
jgi:DNA polymerase elongation subunit (family B)